MHTPEELKKSFEKVWPKYRNGDTNFMDANDDDRFIALVKEVAAALGSYRKAKGSEWMGPGGDR